MFQNVFCVHVRIDNENDYNEHDAIEKKQVITFYHNDKYKVINVMPLDSTTCINTETYKKQANISG